MKVLVVDDSSTMRRIIVNCLKSINVDEVVEAEDGVDGMVKLALGSYDLILTDWNMPNKDGLTFIKEVKADDKYKDVPIIMITTEAEKANVIVALKAGVKNYIVKPFTPDVLKEKIAQVLGTA